MTKADLKSLCKVVRKDTRDERRVPGTDHLLSILNDYKFTEDEINLYALHVRRMRQEFIAAMLQKGLEYQ